MLRLLWNLYLRLIEPFDQWPFVLGRLIHQDVPHRKKEEITDALWSINGCCMTPSDGLTIPLRKMLRTPRDILNEEWYRLLLEDVFKEMPVITILV